MTAFGSLLYGPTFATFGVDATLTVEGLAAVSLRVIDRTSGVELESGEVGVRTVHPAADVKAADITAAGLALADLDGAMLNMNGADWKIYAVMERPTTAGAADGLLRLVLVS